MHRRMLFRLMTAEKVFHHSECESRNKRIEFHFLSIVWGAKPTDSLSERGSFQMTKEQKLVPVF